MTKKKTKDYVKTINETDKVIAKYVSARQGGNVSNTELEEFFIKMNNYVVSIEESIEHKENWLRCLKQELARMKTELNNMEQKIT